MVTCPRFSAFRQIEVVRIIENRLEPGRRACRRRGPCTGQPGRQCRFPLGAIAGFGLSRSPNRQNGLGERREMP
jgi:hypothetical protein